MVPVAQLDAVTVVKYEDLENQLALIQASCGDSTVGLFGPSSVTWSVEREAALFLGAGRALLLQLAHPWIAAAIADRPHTMMDPIGRFHRTFSIMFTMVFGTLDQAGRGTTSAPTSCTDNGCSDKGCRSLS